VVAAVGVEQFADCCNEDGDIAAIARRQLYVAMTRAQDELHLFAGRYARLVGELKRMSWCKSFEHPGQQHLDLTFCNPLCHEYQMQDH
jgi:superfamily I DNA/RNA helicase